MGIKDNRLTAYFLIMAGCMVSLIFSFRNSRRISYPCANTVSCKNKPVALVENGVPGIFNNRPVTVPEISVANGEDMSPVLGVSTAGGEKRIYVDLSTQTLTAYEGDKIIIKTPISSGLWGKTPKGDFNVGSKFRATRMTGGSGADYYDLPNVPFTMFFFNEEIPASRGFAIHGAYWHNNFGHAMSHGCVNMRTVDAQKVFEWADGPAGKKSGTKITIYGDIPE